MGKGVTPTQFNQGSSTRNTQETDTLKEQVRDEVREEFCEKMDEMEAKVSQSQAQVEISLSLLDPSTLQALHAASSAHGKSSHVDLSDGQSMERGNLWFLKLIIKKAKELEAMDKLKESDVLSELSLVGNTAPNFEVEVVFDQEFIKVKCKLMEKTNDSEVTDEVKDQVF
ncbi:hypothetical protein BUALT_Bualt03G0162600 [Buddleja alternifolia]|uniref:Uncharacterized protein n=1 Tax=Buddleja alternifolia TaxID=168488 RepID=A0AAV6Y548_9LAMI|nr:hypothetical protein BUALT_Bualt03G0162600 [Buddleja alternifolia]